MSAKFRPTSLIPYAVIVALFFFGALWLHHDDLSQQKHNVEDCAIQTNHANAINKVIDEIIVFIKTQEQLPPAEKAARIKAYESYKAILPDCSNE